MTVRTIASPLKILLPMLAVTATWTTAALAQQSGQHPRPAQTAMRSDVVKPATQESLKAAVAALNAEQGEFYRNKDAAGIAAEYTTDATYIELLPRLEMMQGRSQILEHFHELIAANATDLVSTITSAEMTSSNTAVVGGDYFLVARDGKKISGHFLQELKREGGAWKIATQVFARPEPITMMEMSDFHSGG
jgi:uncharacterized protein (TIGR02246 family)